MSSWRDTILNEFVLKISRLTIVSDPDALLTEEKLAVALRERGFDLIEFNDAIEFRYAYESNYRSIWDQGKHTDLVIVLRLQDTEVDSLPFDLLNTGRRLSFDLGSLFPNLSYPVLEKIDRSLLDTLFDAQQNYSPGRIGDNATKDFILSHVFGIAAELIKSDVELLRTLLRIHYNSLNIPGELTDRLVQVLSRHKAFVGWPLADVIPDGNAFFEFLQERWPIFLSDQHTNDKIKEVSEGYGLKHRGPDSIPFDHQDIRVYIDNLFVEGKLSPVSADTIEFDINTLQNDAWIKCGITTTGSNADVRITRLLDLIEGGEPTEDSRYSDWTSLAIKWAELAALIHNDPTKEHLDCFLKLGDSLNKTFTAWLNNHYAGLINLPPTNPVMLHHVSRKMARELEDSQCAGVALVVLDGLALDQWISLKQV
ncbi:MAG: BREX-3 system phosphatase PglZ, partial [Candidatus Scalindua sp.]|nr:BREX-3 system phosphatase PglZ [Candidatus Scalindua sp.]